MPTETLDFTLAIRGKPGDYTVEALGPGGVRLEAPFAHPSPERIQALLAKIEQHDYPAIAEMKEIGAELFRALLPSPILRALMRAEVNLPPGTGLRLKLAGQPLELARLPWELLYDPDERGFLLRRLSSPVVRFIETRRPPTALRAELPLRVLHIQANPRGTDGLDMETSAAAIHASLGEAGIVTELPAATPAALRKVLREGQGYHILHYDGHATLEGDTGRLFLHDEVGDPAPVTGEMLADWLDGSSVRLVVLAACKSGMASETRPFAGVAYQLMAASTLPAVIAMQFAIADTAAIAFNRGLYAALADGSPVDGAMVEGRQHILDEAGYEERGVAWAAPVLFMRTLSGEVLAPREEGVPSRKEGEELEARYLEAVVERWQYIEEGDEGKVPLTDVFVMLQALDATRRTPRELRPDLASTPERLDEAGLKSPDERHSGNKPPPLPPKPIPLSEALQQEQHLLVLGEPGGGKSTTLHFIALCFARPGMARENLELEEERIPLLAHLRELVVPEQGFRLEEALVAQVTRLEPNEVQARHLLSSWLHEERLVLLLDGLDEVPGEVREGVRQEIRRFATSPEGKRCRIVASSRLAGYQDLHPFKEYQIKPFEGAEDAQPYVAGWLAALCRWEKQKANEEAEHLLEEMGKRPALKRLVNNPLLLRLAVSLYVRSGEVAQNRTLLYRRYLDESAWPRARARAKEVPDQDMARRALEIVAWALQVRGPQSEAQLGALLREGLEEVRDPLALLAFLREQLGLLVRYPVKAEWYLAFSHLTFQEYFVAERLARWWDEFPERTWAFLYQRLHHPAWHEPLLLLAAALPTPETTALVRHILHARSPYESILHRDLRLVLEMTRDGARITTPLGKTIEKELGVLLRGSWFQEPGRIYEMLAEAGAPITVPILGQEFVDGRWWYTKRLAARALGQISDAHALPHLFRALTNTDSGVRKAAAEALGQIGEAQALPYLFRALADTYPGVREAAAKALGRIGDTQVLPYLLQALADDHLHVRAAAAQALGQIGDAQTLPHLLRQVLADDHPGVRVAVVKALGQIGEAQALPDLLQALADYDSRIRAAAAEALGQIGEAQTLPYLRQALAHHDSQVRAAAARALGRMGDTQAIPHLLQALADDNFHVRVAVAQALGRMGDRQMLSHLRQALAHHDSWVRVAAARALGQIGNAQALPDLLQALADNHPRVRVVAVEALGQIGAEALPDLLQALVHHDSQVRAAAAQALGQMGDTQALPHLLQALADTYSGVCAVAAQALGQIGDVQALPDLLQALVHHDSQVRAAAAQALGQMGDTQALPHLLHALADTYSEVCVAAAWALGQMGDTQALPHLLHALADTNPWVRTAAVGALESLLTQAPIKSIQDIVCILQGRPLNDVGETYPLLQQAVTRLTELEVAALPPGDPTTTPLLPLWHGRERLITLATAIALLSIAIALLPPGPVELAAWVALAVMAVALIVEGVRWWQER